MPLKLLPITQATIKSYCVEPCSVYCSKEKGKPNHRRCKCVALFVKLSNTTSTWQHLAALAASIVVRAKLAEIVLQKLNQLLTFDCHENALMQA